MSDQLSTSPFDKKEIGTMELIKKISNHEIWLLTIKKCLLDKSLFKS